MIWLLSAALAVGPPLVVAATPAYPPAALADGVTGTVVVRVQIAPDGQVTEVSLVRGIRDDVDAAAIEAARRLVFAPADGGDTAEGSTVDYAFTFGVRVQDDVGNAVPGSARVTVTDPLGLPVPGATVRIVAPDGTASTEPLGDDGLLSLPFLAAGVWRLTFTKPGFSPATVDLEIGPGERRDLRFELEPEGPMAEVVVIGIRQRWREVDRAERAPDPSPTTGVYELTRRDVESTPGALEDMNRAIHKLPGVTSDGDVLAAFSVRGFTAGEVVFELDRVPLDNPYHLAGFNSIFNPDILASVTFYASAAPSEHPDTSSAVLAVKSWDGAPKDDRHDLDGSVDLSMSTARLLLMGPIGKGDDLTFAFAARRSYLEAYFGAMQAVNLLDSAIAAPEYDEISLRTAWRPGNHTLLLTLMRTGDHLALVDSDDASTVTIDGSFELDDVVYLATLDHHVRLGETATLQTTVSASTDDARMVRDFAGVVDRTTHRTQLFARSDLDVPLGDTMALGTGAAWTARRTTFDGPVDDIRALPTWSARPLADFGLDLLTLSQADFSSVVAGYAEHTYGGTEKQTPFRSREGVRVSWVQRTDELLVSPSAGVSVPLPTATIPKLTGGFYHHVVEDPLVVDPTYGNPGIRAEKVAHVVLGVDQGLPIGTGTLLRVEGYYSRLWDLVVNPDNPEAVASGVTFTNDGYGHNAGVDLLLASRLERWQLAFNGGWLHARRTNPLNSVYAATVEPGHVQALTLGLSVEYQLTPAWRLTGRYDFHTGRPMSAVRVDGLDTVVLDGFNDERLGPFNQVDLRVEWRKALPRVRWSVYFEVLNATYFRSDFLPIVSVTEGERSDTMLPHLPTRPFLGVRSEF